VITNTVPTTRFFCPSLRPHSFAWLAIKPRIHSIRGFFTSTRRCLLSCLLAGLGVFSPLAAAEDSSAFSLHGFGTIGAVRTNTDSAQFVRDLYQQTGAEDKWSGNVDTVLGVQGNLRINSSLSGVVQVVSRYHFGSTYDPEVSWAFLKYDPTPQLSFRAGRLGTEFFMLSDSRLVGYSYLTVRPSGDYFWHLPFYSINGADAALTVPLGDDVLRFKVFHGVSDEEIPLSKEAWDLDGSRMSGAYVDYQRGPWQLRASFASILFKNNLPLRRLLLETGAPLPVVEDAERILETDDQRADFYSLGAVYDRGPWQFQLMLNRIRQESEFFENSEAAYALVGYRVGGLTPFVGISKVRSSARTPTANPVANAFMLESRVDQHTVTLGARWDIAHDIALKAQVDEIRGRPESVFPYRNEDNSKWSGDMRVFSLSMDFLF
jgi:hypothetical protein